LSTFSLPVGSLNRKRLWVFLVSVVLLAGMFCNPAAAQSEEDQKAKVVAQVAAKWVDVGREQLKRGYFDAAEKSFLQARKYVEYLGTRERQEIDEYLTRAREAARKREGISDRLAAAEKLFAQGQWAQARQIYVQIRKDAVLNENELQQVSANLAEIEKQLAIQRQEAYLLYERSVELYEAGQLAEASKGFAKVAECGLLENPAGKRAADYLSRIEKELAAAEPVSAVSDQTEAAAVQKQDVQTGEADVEQTPVADEPAGSGEETAAEPPEVQEPAELTEPGPAQAGEAAEANQAEPAEGQAVEGQDAETRGQADDSYISVINRKRSILRSHTKAVVSDAVEKARRYIGEGDFVAASEAVAKAERTVKANALHLGDDLCAHYDGVLKELVERIERLERAKAARAAEQRREDAIVSQRQYRRQMETARGERISELTRNATAFQKQQRYEEALGELESLLAIDPLNNEALILKQTLDDTIGFRKQLEVEKESRRERAEILRRTDESMIPYAKEITYPKNWREIVASKFRTPEEAIGQNAANVAVYEQLDEIVDLSDLTRETPFSEAIDAMRNAVDPPLKIVVLWRDLSDNADIDQFTPINMDPLTSVPLKTALELLLKSVSGGFADIGYVVEDGVVTIATEDSLPSELETLVYDVTDLLGQQADFFASTRGGQGGTSGNEQDVGGGFQDEDEEDRFDRSEREQMAGGRMDALMYLIQETIEPDSWYEYGGEGTINVYENKKLIVRQTREIHNRIEKLLNEMRKSLGHQVAIEARFLLVGENFLEDIGLDVDLDTWDTKSKWGVIKFQQQSYDAAQPAQSGVPGSLAGTVASLMQGGYGTYLDDLQVSFLVKATQAHRDSKSLTAPKLTVVSGESAALRVQKVLYYAGDIDVDTRESGDFARSSFTVNYDTYSVTSGSILNVTPIITPDKKHVLLTITAELRDFLGFRRQAVELPIFGGGEGIAGAGGQYTIEFPETEVSRVQTRVNVPDGGTLLLGGQKVTTEVEKEAGVPVLSKVPVIGRLFSNRSKVKDHKILLILVKPTIVLQEEAEAKAIAAMKVGG